MVGRNGKVVEVEKERVSRKRKKEKRKKRGRKGKKWVVKKKETLLMEAVE